MSYLIEKEAKEYLQKHRVQHILEQITTQLLADRPDDVHAYIIDHVRLLKEEEDAKHPAPAATTTTSAPSTPADDAAPTPADPSTESQTTADGTHDDASTTSTAPKPDDHYVIFVLGGPGSGKGTQCARIVDEFDFVHLSAGDLLRAEIKSGSETAALIDTYIREGKIVPYEITIGLLKASMAQHPGKKFLIDGFPRAMDQCEAFVRIVNECRFVLFLDVDEETMLQRLLHRGETSGRTDDNIESIRKRFRTFQEQSMDVIHHYDGLSMVRKISSAPPPDEVFATVREVLNEDLKKL